MTESADAELDQIWQQTTDALREEMANLEESIARGFAEMHDRLDGILAEQQVIAERLDTALEPGDNA